MHIYVYVERVFLNTWSLLLFKDNIFFNKKKKGNRKDTTH